MNHKPILVTLILLVMFSTPLISANTFGYNYLDNEIQGNITNEYINNTYINQTANLSGYWTSNGSSTATGNFDLGTNNLTAQQLIASGLTASEIKTNYLNVQQGLGTTIKFGADVNAQTLTDNTRKFGRIASPHYDTDEEDVALFSADSTSTQNILNFGGGSNQLNTATDLIFYTASNPTTLTGTNRFQINSAGLATFSNSIDVTDDATIRDTLRIGALVASAVAPLDIQKSLTGFNRMIKVGGGSGTTNYGGYIEFPTSTVDGYGPQIGGLRSGAGGAGDLIIRTGLNTQAERFRVTDGGSIGIGVTPTQKFHVVENNVNAGRDIVALFQRTGTRQQAKIVLKDGNGTSTDSRLFGIQFSSVSSQASFVNYEGGEWVWWTNPTAGSATRRFRILNTGEVIVGEETGTPSNLFSVKGNAVVGSGLMSTSAPTNGLIVQGDVNLQSSLSVGSNTNAGLSAGDINASTIYYNVLQAKSPIILCSDNWCIVELPQAKEGFYLQKDNDWNVLQITDKSGKTIESKEFIWENGFIVGAVKLNLGEVLNKTTKLRDELQAENQRKILQEQERIIKEQERIEKENIINTCLSQNYTWRDNDGCYNVFNEVVTYSQATTTKPIYIKEIQEYSCTELDTETLMPIQTTCTKEVETTRLERNQIVFKDGCSWNNEIGYYCTKEIKI